MSAQLNVIKRMRFNQQVKILGIVAAILGVVLIALWARYHSLVATTKPTAAGISQRAGTIGGPRSARPTLEDANVLSTTLSPSGFSPREMSNVPGAFNLRVKNLSEQQEIVLRLSNSNGDIVADARLTNKVAAWTTPLKLSPGVYTLREANHDEWICQIQIPG